ncbi:hypothetical protein CKAH01_05818 [Colletotrichum kahawae]|uniref:Uncharacterized protein n=1 Tax=Colletotrichum kahawae TaxID=34407 RepID=A0AAE0D7A2_COLKA|nr:hypothetical protein CKAH01_05818 [Colletotrichum kahawae]
MEPRVIVDSYSTLHLSGSRIFYAATSRPATMHSQPEISVLGGWLLGYGLSTLPGR